MKHLRLFETETAFEAEKANLPEPWVALANDVEKIYFGESGEPQPTIEFVDLGLPSGKKWMKYNLGATSETEYGDYYMWGSVTPNTDTVCDWEHAPFNNGASSFDSTYFNAHKSEWLDGDVLKPEYDAVYQATGGQAHMPTKEDFEELTANTTSTWTSVNGVDGNLFTSKTNGNQMFIPASGLRRDSSVYYQVDIAYLWGSTLFTYSPTFVWGLDFSSGGIKVNYLHRYNGFCVRGVKD